ncbi:hypothetical protein EJ576_09500 [Pseudomonas sp. C 49-2]|jgi:hypothetical protein|uniref:hypothetical protein n=1 Tax=Pseudomonas TaxID=286 RepID=UPI000F8200C8|nr:hypothetical protein [Pseudomonas sp. C 49-2]RTY00544.1 hypothetical protein EJ576_09500 [Pseudomonas sp. C 49-2]
MYVSFKTNIGKGKVMSSENPKIEVVGPKGTYQICLKSGATVVLDGVELCTYAPIPNPPVPVEPQYFFFQKEGVRVSFTAHFVGKNTHGEKPLDDVIDAIFRLK